MDQQTLPTLKHLFRSVASAFVVWNFGYFGVNFSWLLFGLALFSLWKYRRRQRQRNGKFLLHLMQDEEAVVSSMIQKLPAWVTFPDTERANWLNEVAVQLWPFLSTFISKMLKDELEPQVKKKLPSFLKSFRFQEISLGNVAPKLGGIKVYEAETNRKVIVVDLDIIYAGDASVKVSLKGMTGGVTGIQIRGNLRVMIGPLMNTSPLIGGVSLFFLSDPEVDFDLTELLNVLETPGLSDILRACITEAISQLMVLPNRIFIPLTDKKTTDALRYPQPVGVIHITIHEAKDLEAKDVNIFSKNTSDPYVIVHVGAEEFRTSSKSSTVDPKWNESFEVAVDSKVGQKINIFLFDEDVGSFDEPLGRAEINVEDVISNGDLDTWLPLEGSENGRIRVSSNWYEVKHDIELLKEPQKGDEFSSALLCVKIDSAREIPIVDNEGARIYCKVTVGNKSFDSKVVANQNNPIWQEMFRFFVYDPKYQQCNIKVLCEDTEEVIGLLDLDLSLLLESEDMKINQRFPLTEADAESTITVGFELWAVTDLKSSTKDGIEGKKQVGEQGSSELRQRKPLTTFGEIQLDIKWDGETNKLLIHVLKAEKLPLAKGETSKTDAYVVFYLLPDKSNSGRRESKGKQANSEVEFDEKFDYFIGHEELTKRSLLVEVCQDGGTDAAKSIAHEIIDMKSVDLVIGERKWYRLKEGSGMD